MKLNLRAHEPIVNGSDNGIFHLVLLVVQTLPIVRYSNNKTLHPSDWDYVSNSLLDDGSRSACRTFWNDLECGTLYRVQKRVELYAHDVEAKFCFFSSECQGVLN
jgi:hypothetical protein